MVGGVLDAAVVVAVGGVIAGEGIRGGIVGGRWVEHTDSELLPIGSEKNVPKTGGE